MNRSRFFVKSLLFLSLLLFLLQVIIIFGKVGVVEAADICETRAAWISHGFDSPEEREFTINGLKKGNFNTIFVIAPEVECDPLRFVCKENCMYYKNCHYGRRNPAGFLEFINKSKGAGLSVHAWVMNNGRLDNELHETNVDFRVLSEQEAQKEWALSLIKKYPQLDGIHLDYIRYGYKQPINYDNKLGSVSQTVEKIYRGLKNLYPNKFLTAAVFKYSQADAVSNVDEIPLWFTNWWNLQSPKGQVPNGIYYPQSATEFKIPSNLKYQQDSIGWILNNVIDTIIPMTYTVEDSDWIRQTYTLKSFLGDNFNRSCMGIGWFKDEHFQDLSHVVRKIRAGKEIGVKGFSIFSFDHRGEMISLNNQLIDSLTVNSALNEFDAPFKNPIRSCLSSSVWTPTSTRVPTPTPRPSFTPTPTISTSFCKTCSSGLPSFSRGNANCDNEINILDFYLLRNVLIKLQNDENVTESEKAGVDFSCQTGQTSHTIDLEDFNIWVGNYKETF